MPLIVTVPKPERKGLESKLPMLSQHALNIYGRPTALLSELRAHDAHVYRVKESFMKRSTGYSAFTGMYTCNTYP